jgi:hypothetical protein
MESKRLNRYISQMEAFRRKHEPRVASAIEFSATEFRFVHSNEQYAWSDNSLLQYGGYPQEDHP